jgi:hypothetical protein
VTVTTVATAWVSDLGAGGLLTHPDAADRVAGR